MDQPLNHSQAQLAENADEQVSLKEVLLTGLRKWKWIVASVVVCLCLAGLYLARTPKSYTATAAVEIKNNDTGEASSALSAFADMGIGTPNSNLYNESAYFQSPDLMESVVEALGLNVSYSMRKGLKTISPYGNDLPLKVNFYDTPMGDYGSFTLDMNDEGLIRLSKFRINSEKHGFESKTFRIGERVKTPLGYVVVEAGPAFMKGRNYKMTVSKTTISRAASYYSSRLKVAVQSNEGTVLDFSIIDQSPVRAKDILISLIKAYNDNWILDKNQIAVSTSGFINERLGMIEQELGNVDSDISSYKSQHMVPDVAATAAMYMTENQDINKRVLEINNRLQMARYLKDHLMSDQSNSRTLPVNLGLDNASIDRQISAYNDWVLQRNTLVANSGEANPLVQEMDASLRNMRASLFSSLDNEIKALTTDMRNVQSRQGNVSSKIAANPTQAKYLLTVERQQKVKESLYLYLLQKREENELNKAFTPYNTRIIARPAVSRKATSPRSGMILGVAFLFGLIFPFGLIYLQEANNTKVRGRKDLESLGIPFLGEIPLYHAKKGEDKNTLMVVKPSERDVINEAFRIMRTNLTFMVDKKCPVTIISSFNPGSGKTFITMNLAECLAIRGVKTLVIDGDLRRHSASGYVGNPKLGLSQYLNGKDSDLESLIVKTDYSDNLYILPAGFVPPNPTELLESERLGQAIEKLRQKFSFILIDCPPIGVLADPRILETFADNTIIVVRAGLLERSMLPALKKIYENKEYRNISVVLNCVSSSAGQNSYSYGYAYGTKNYYTPT